MEVFSLFSPLFSQAGLAECPWVGIDHAQRSSLPVVLFVFLPLFSVDFNVHRAIIFSLFGEIACELSFSLFLLHDLWIAA